MTKTLAATFGVSAVLGLSALAPPPPRLVWNASESVPIGLYAITAAKRLELTQLVLVAPPEPLATFLDEGRYVPRGVPLLKRIAALPGQTVCRTGVEVTVDGVTQATARVLDRRGRPLPVWAGCWTLMDGEVFLLNWDAPASLDGRYFGPLPRSTVVGRATPVWTREDG